MASTSPARIDDDLYASAKLAGTAQSRSASQQVVHWARIGREIEASESISAKEIGAVLAGARSYDSLGPREQAVVRAEWTTRMDELRADVDLAASFRSAGQTWVELDDEGNVVVERDGTTRRAARVAATKKPATKKATTKKAGVKKAAAKRARAAG